MSAATQAKSARARARIAARMLLRNRAGWAISRAFDDCFECGDGNAVYRELISMATRSDDLRQAMRQHRFLEWADEAERLIESPVALLLGPQ